MQKTIPVILGIDKLRIKAVISPRKRAAVTALMSSSHMSSVKDFEFIMIALDVPRSMRKHHGVYLLDFNEFKRGWIKRIEAYIVVLSLTSGVLSLTSGVIIDSCKVFYDKQNAYEYMKDMVTTVYHLQTPNIIKFPSIFGSEESYASDFVQAKIFTVELRFGSIDLDRRRSPPPARTIPETQPTVRDDTSADEMMVWRPAQESLNSEDERNIEEYLLGGGSNRSHNLRDATEGDYDDDEFVTEMDDFNL